MYTIITINASVVDINRARRGRRRALKMTRAIWRDGPWISCHEWPWNCHEGDSPSGNLGHKKQQIQGPPLQSFQVIFKAQLIPLRAGFLSTTEALDGLCHGRGIQGPSSIVLDNLCNEVTTCTYIVQELQKFRTWKATHAPHGKCNVVWSLRDLMLVHI